MYIYWIKLNKILKNLCFISLFSIVVYANQNDNKTNIELEISTNKHHLKLNDEIILTYKLINNSDKAISFSSRGIGRHPFKFHIISDQKLLFKSNIIRKMRILPLSKEDFEEIGQNKFKEFTRKVSYKKGRVHFSSNDIYNGRYLYLPGRYYILLDNEKELFISSEYKLSEKNISLAKYFGIENVFSKKLKSNVIKITLE